MKTVLAGSAEDKNQYPGLACSERLVVQAETIANPYLQRMDFNPGVWPRIQKSAAQAVQ